MSPPPSISCCSLSIETPGNTRGSAGSSLGKGNASALRGGRPNGFWDVNVWTTATVDTQSRLFPITAQPTTEIIMPNIVFANGQRQHTFLVRSQSTTEN